MGGLASLGEWKTPSLDPASGNLGADPLFAALKAREVKIAVSQKLALALLKRADGPGNVLVGECDSLFGLVGRMGTDGREQRSAEGEDVGNKHVKVC